MSAVPPTAREGGQRGRHGGCTAVRHCGSWASAGNDSKCRLLASSVPDVKNLHATGLLRRVGEDAVRTENDLTQGAACASRIRGADKRKRCENANVVENTPSHPMGCLRVVARDVGADVMDVCNRRVGPDYLEVHAVAHESTSCSTS